jgi:predicted permease
MGTLLPDLRFGVRLLVRNPGFTLVAVLSLALGIGANSTIFTLVNAVLLKPLPVDDSARLVAVFTTYERNPGAPSSLGPTAYPNFKDYRDQNRAFTTMAAHSYNGLPLAFSDDGEPEQILGEMVSGDFFALLGVTPALGRAFLADEDSVPGEKPVTVVSHNFWQRRLGGDPEIVGKTITLNGHAFTVVGVAPKGFKGANAIFSPALWVPMMAHPQLATGFLRENMDTRRALLFTVVGRLKPGMTLEQAQADLKTIADRLARDYPNDNAGRSVALVPLAQATINLRLRQSMVRAGALLMTVVALVLLIACANVAILLLARAAVRQREVAVRISLGASRGKLLRQLLTEGLLLALLGGALGMAITYWAQWVLWSQRPPWLAADAVDLTPDARVLGFTALVSLLTVLVFALAPALSASRPDPVAQLKQRSGPAFGGNRLTVRDLLAVGQVALSLVALVGAGLFLKSLRNAQRIDPGFDHVRIGILTVNLGAHGYDEARAHEFHRQMLERAVALPGVESATLATGIPLFQGTILRTVFPEGVDSSDRKNGRLVQLNTVDLGYFETMEIPLRRGRDFAETDHAGSPHVVVINEELARQLWPGDDAIGKRFKFFGQEWWNEVIGIAADIKYSFLGEDPQPYIYLSLRQVYEPAVTLHLRTRSAPATALGMARRKVQEMNRTLPITNVLTYGEILRQSLWEPRMGASLLAVFGLLSLLLAVIGVYGVMSYSVSQRTRELGVRMALGAAQGDVLKLVVRQGVSLAAGGIVIGLAVSLAATRLIANLLFDVSARDPLTFVAIPLLLGLAALLASLQPAWRATKVDPTVALRSE